MVRKKKLRFIGDSRINARMRAIDSKFMSLYRNLPFTYFWLYRRAFGNLLSGSKTVTMLDLGCGDGTATNRLNLPSGFEITGVDIFKKYLEIAKTLRIYQKLNHSDIKKYNPRSKFDVVVASHVLEHLNKKDGLKFIRKLENIAQNRVIIATPIGQFPQEDIDKNKYQIHKSTWDVEEMKNLGYKVYAQGFRSLWGESNVIKEYGVLSYFFFLLSYLLSPLLVLRPEWGTYMICVKCLETN